MKIDRGYETLVNRGYETLVNYIINRYNSFDPIASFHVEYNHQKQEMIVEVYGVKITKNNFMEKIDIALEGVYEIFQLENEPSEGELIELVCMLEDIQRLKC